MNSTIQPKAANVAMPLERSDITPYTREVDLDRRTYTARFTQAVVYEGRTVHM